LLDHVGTCVSCRDRVTRDLAVPAGRCRNEGTTISTGETGFDDVTFDLISVQYHSLKAGHDYGQYVPDARNAGQDEIAQFFERVMLEDSDRGSSAIST
jgi:hypothetical protein